MSSFIALTLGGKWGGRTLLCRYQAIFPYTHSNNQLLRLALYSQSTRKELQRVWTIPNALSTSRIILSPLVGHAILAERPIFALSLVVLCGVSDLADGWIARRWRQESALGSLLDPIGDKLLIGVLASTLVWKNMLPVWVAIIFLTRDISLIMAGLYVRFRTLPRPFTLGRFINPSIATTKVSPTIISKVNTALQLLTLGLSLAVTPALHNIIPINQIPSLTPLYCIVSASTIWSLFRYIKDYRKVVKFIKK